MLNSARSICDAFGTRQHQVDACPCTPGPPTPEPVMASDTYQPGPWPLLARWSGPDGKSARSGYSDLGQHQSRETLLVRNCGGTAGGADGLHAQDDERVALAYVEVAVRVERLVTHTANVLRVGLQL